MAQRELTFPLRSLPPILHIPHRIPVSGYSKGSRGLSVLPWVIGIFTDTPISPSPLLRQRSDRYTIRAGRNLPDKEFRYLRTVRSCYIPFDSGWSDRFRLTLYVAIETGPSHLSFESLAYGL